MFILMDFIVYLNWIIIKFIAQCDIFQTIKWSMHSCLLTTSIFTHFIHILLFVVHCWKRNSWQCDDYTNVLGRIVLSKHPSDKTGLNFYLKQKKILILFGSLKKNRSFSRMKKAPFQKELSKNCHSIRDWSWFMVMFVIRLHDVPRW